MKEEIIKFLKENETIDLCDGDNVLTIYYKKFYSQGTEYLFILNSSAIYFCKTEKSALNKIDEFLKKDFQIYS